MWVVETGPFFFQIHFDFFPQLLSFFFNIKLASDTIPFIGNKNNVVWIKARHLVLYLHFNYWIQYHWKLERKNKKRLVTIKSVYSIKKINYIAYRFTNIVWISFLVLFFVSQLFYRAAEATYDRQHLLIFNTISYVIHYLYS